jgi:hypothetical protein
MVKMIATVAAATLILACALLLKMAIYFFLRLMRKLRSRVDGKELKEKKIEDPRNDETTRKVDDRK